MFFGWISSHKVQTVRYNTHITEARWTETRQNAQSIARGGRNITGIINIREESI